MSDLISIDTKIDNSNIELYLPDREKILHGNPTQQLDNQYTSKCCQFSTGIWTGEVGKWQVCYTEEEYCEILEGVSVVTNDKGKQFTVSVGDRFILPKGFIGEWEVIERCVKLYVVFESNK